MEQKPDRSDYFTWKPGDLIPAGTPVPSLQERRAALLAQLPDDVRAKVEIAMAKESQNGSSGQ